MRWFTLYESNWNRRRLACVMNRKKNEAVVIWLFEHGSACRIVLTYYIMLRTLLYYSIIKFELLWYPVPDTHSTGMKLQDQATAL